MASSGLGNLAAIIQQTKQQEQMALEENKRLKVLVSIQDALVGKERSILVEVAKTSTELQEVEKKRAELKAKLAGQKTQMLITVAESTEVSRVVERVVSATDQPSIASSNAGSMALKAIEGIQSSIFGLVSKCLESETISVDGDSLNELVVDVSEVVEAVVQNGGAEEKLEDTIRRQGYVLAAMVPGQEEDETETETETETE